MTAFTSNDFPPSAILHIHIPPTRNRTTATMHTPNFQNMSAEEFKAYRPRTEEEQDAHDKESEYRTRCEDDGEDFGDENTRAMYEEIELETGPSAWDDMDEDDRPGWEDNMNKDS